MGSDVRRWPNSVLGCNDRFCTHSPLARIDAHGRAFTNMDDRRATHVCASDKQVWLYKRASCAIVLRWRFDADTRHVQVQLARDAANATNLRQQMVDAGYRGVLAAAQFPVDFDGDYVERFLALNDFEYDLIKGGLQPRPGILRVPIVARASSAAKGDARWRVMSVYTGLPRHGQELLLGEGVSVVWCALHGVRTRTDLLPNIEEKLLSVIRMSAKNDGENAASTKAGVVRWLPPVTLPNADSLRSYVVTTAAPTALQSVPSNLRVLLHDNAKGATIRARVERDGTIVTTAVCRRADPNEIKAGGIYVTDEGLRTGFPLTHTSDRTLFFDNAAYDIDHTHRNDMLDLILAESDRPGRAGMLGILNALLRIRGRYLGVVSDAPLWRAQLCAVLKLVPVVGIAPLPEDALVVENTDEICLTPDEKSVRVRKKPLVLPLINHVELVAPYFADSLSLEAADEDCALLDAHLDVADATLRADSVILRTDERGRLRATKCAPNVPWSADTIFAFRKRRWRNRPKPMPLRVDEFASIPDHLRRRGTLLIQTSQGVVLLDLHEFRDARTLILPTRSIYRSTSVEKIPNLMLRPFPSVKDMQTMIDFCNSMQCSELFR